MQVCKGPAAHPTQVSGANPTPLAPDLRRTRVLVVIQNSKFRALFLVKHAKEQRVIFKLSTLHLNKFFSISPKLTLNASGQ